MLYLLDANVLIDANRDYYPIERVPEFWDWLKSMGELGHVKVPEEIYEEIVLPRPRPDNPHRLVDWLTEHQDVLRLDEPVSTGLVAYVTEQGYAADLTDDEIEKVGRDPFLIAYALVDVQERCVVTNERSRPSRRRGNRHIPDVADALSARCIDAFGLIQELDFRTDWRSNP